MYILILHFLSKLKTIYFFSSSFSSFSRINEFIKSLTPITKKVMEAIDLRNTSGKKLEIDPPVNAPSKLVKTSAEEEPKKTAIGLFDVPLIVKVAS